MLAEASLEKQPMISRVPSPPSSVSGSSTETASVSTVGPSAAQQYYQQQQQSQSPTATQTNATAGPSSPPSTIPATPAPLTLEQQHITAVDGIVPTLQNIVATVIVDQLGGALGTVTQDQFGSLDSAGKLARKLFSTLSDVHPPRKYLIVDGASSPCPCARTGISICRDCVLTLCGIQTSTRTSRQLRTR